MAKRRITQETFDAAVRENVEDLEMDPDEAVREAVEQFESQGVDLSCIVKAGPSEFSDGQGEPTHTILKALDSLRKGRESVSLPEMAEELTCFTEQCSLGFPQRYLAAQKDAYPIILSYCKKSMEEEEGVATTLSAFAALTDGQPDLLEAEGRQILLGALKKYQGDPLVTRAAVSVVRNCCLKHEQNRQDLVKEGVLPLLTGAITRHTGRAELVKEASAALRVMTFDDDVRVTFGHAHDHAKMIVLEHNGLKVLIEAAKAYHDNPPLLSELCAALSRLAVRNEFCQDICDLGGLKLMMTLLADNYESADLSRQVLSAMRAIAGNDDVKDAVVAAGGVQLIVIVMNKHARNPADLEKCLAVEYRNNDVVLISNDRTRILGIQKIINFLKFKVCEQGCACLSVLALRKPKNCTVIMEDGGALAALQAMKDHQLAVNVQKQACMLLRNLVAHMQNYCQPILDMGAETLIGKAVQKHPDCDDVGKAALRDLGCKVELRELWTGTHGSLSN